MEATVLLCDFAEAVNGKLYVMGGGWTNLWSADRPVSIAVAAMISVPWDQANQRHGIRMELLDHDGAPVLSDGNVIALDGQFEMGRPAGVKPGTSLNAPVTWRLDGLVLSAGGYEIKVSIDGEVVASRPFTVDVAPLQAPGA